LEIDSLQIDSLTLSLDGARESNNVNRVSGTYDKTIQVIHINFHSHTVFIKKNKNAVMKLCRLPLNIGLKPALAPYGPRILPIKA